MPDELKKPTDQAQTESNQPAPGAADPPRQADIPPQDQIAAPQDLSEEAANHVPAAKVAEQGSIASDADRLTGEENKIAGPQEVDLKPSQLELVVDTIVMLSHDEDIERGDERYTDQDSISKPSSFEPKPTLDLIREESAARPICVSLVEWDQSRPKLTHGSSIRFLGRWNSVPQLPRVLYDSLLLPTGLEDYGTTRELFERILRLLKRHLTLLENQHKLLAYWCIASWFPDALDFIPRLTITGQRFAADLLFRVLRCVCRRPVLLAGINSAVLKAVPFNELMPTLLIRETRLNKRKAELLDASDQKDYLVANGADLQRLYCAKCVYLGEDHSQLAVVSDGIHVHVDNARSPTLSLPPDDFTQTLQNQLFQYRSRHHEHVTNSRFGSDGLLPELGAVAQQLGSTIVGDDNLQKRIIDVLKGRSEHARVDRCSGLKAMVLRAVLFHCHQSDQQQVFARDLAATVNRVYREEGESLKVSSETVGRVLKSLGLYSRRLGNGGRGLMLDKSTQVQAHELSHAYEVLPAAPDCGYCHRLQSPQSEGVV